MLMINVINKIFNTLLILIIIILCIYFVLYFLNKAFVYNVITGSMEDNIHSGDYVLIIRQDDYNIGDVITYKKDNYYITHRIIDMNGDIIITKGDANNIVDEQILKKSIAGKVIFSGGILNFIRYKYIIVSFVLSMYLFTWYLEEKENK